MTEKKILKKLDILEQKAIKSIRQAELLKIVQKRLTTDELSKYTEYYYTIYGFNPFSILD